MSEQPSVPNTLPRSNSRRLAGNLTEPSDARSTYIVQRAERSRTGREDAHNERFRRSERSDTVRSPRAPAWSLLHATRLLGPDVSHSGSFPAYQDRCGPDRGHQDRKSSLLHGRVRHGITRNRNAGKLGNSHRQRDRLKRRSDAVHESAGDGDDDSTAIRAWHSGPAVSMSYPQGNRRALPDFFLRAASSNCTPSGSPGVEMKRPS